MIADHVEGQPQTAAAHSRLTGLTAVWALVWSHGAPLLLAVLALLATLLAYRQPAALSLDLAETPSPLRFRGTYPVEQVADGSWQRWTQPAARLTIPGTGAAPAVVRLHFYAGESGGRQLTLAGADQQLAATALRSGRQTLAVLAPATAFDPRRGDLDLVITTDPLRVSGDTRALGVSLTRLELASTAGARPVLPAGLAAELVVVVGLAFWALRLTGMRTRHALLASGALLALLATTLALGAGELTTPRLQGVLGVRLLAEILPWTVGLALLTLFVTRRWGELRVPGWAVAVRCAVLLIFTVRLAGIEHPQFVHIDQNLRANQLINLAEGRAEVVRPGLEQQWEWGTREPIPYSLLTYRLLQPLVYVTPDHDDLVDAVKLVTVLLDATVPLLLWLLLAGGPLRNIAAGWAGLVYAGLPVGYFFFHDGSFPTTIGLWLVLLALAALRLALMTGPGQRGVLAWAATTLLLALGLAAYVTHIAFVPFLVGILALSMLALGTARQRRPALLTAAALLIAIGGAWLAIYRDYTLVLVQRTVPAFLELIAAEGSVGRDAEQFFGTPINSFPQHLVAHFRVWPVLLATTALAGLLAGRRDRWLTHLGLAFGLFFAATAVAERWFGLWNKHMYFAAPGVALLAGLGLAWLWRRGRAGKVCCLLLIAFLFWESTLAWGNRVIWYSMPPEAL